MHMVVAGPFYAFEGSTATQQISGTALVDVDLLESCSYANQGCSTVDAKVAVLHGGITLGSQGGISVYKNTYTTQAFTGPLGSSTIALSTVLYVALSGDPTAVPTFNTQTLQADGSLPTETVTFEVSDQSFSGAIVNGFATAQFGIAEIYDLVLNITVVAMNQAPVISAPAQLAAMEDVRLSINGLTVSDVDADSTIKSALAQHLWLNLTEYQNYINKVQLNLSVVHGRLYFPTLKSMSVVSATDQIYYVLQSRYTFHDLCRMKAVYSNPSSTTSYTATCIKAIDKTICPTGVESTCQCSIVDTCSTAGTGSTTLFLNTSLPTYASYITALQLAISVTDLTCGGVPVYPSPDIFTTGELCTSNDDCKALTSCADSAEGCLCCANLNISCSTDSDCSAVEQGSLCGCSWYGPAGSRPAATGTNPGPGQCGPWIKSALWAVFAQTPTGLGDLLSNCLATNTYLGVSCQNSLYRQSERPTDCPTCQGIPCTYVGAGFQTCIPPVLLSLGTGISQVTDPLSSTGAVSIVFYGQLRLVNQVLAQMEYQTNLYYNRLYRIPQCYPPPLQLTTACIIASDNDFNPTVDSNEFLSISVDDLGNSGGIARDIKITNDAVKIVVAAVNNPPSIIAPYNILAVEDMSFSFLNLQLLAQAGFSLPAPEFFVAYLENQCQYDINLPDKKFDDSMGATCLCYRTCQNPLLQFTDFSCSCANPDCDVLCDQDTEQLAVKESNANIVLTPRLIGTGISITDPDYSDYGFLNMDFSLNISCLHGRILLNEAFLQQRDMLSTRIKILNYQGYGVASTNPSISENMGVGLYYLTHGTECDFCATGWTWVSGIVQCCDPSCRVCPMWGVGNSFVALSGTMADLNLALSNVTYVGDLHFNTRYGIAEAISIVVNDNGALGDVYRPLQNSIVIDVQVESVNDPPTVGHLVPVLKDVQLDVISLATINLYQFEMESINQTMDYVEVDEDIPFVFNHTWLWVDDVDAQEAYIIETLVPGISLAESYLDRTYSCYAGGDFAGYAFLASLSDDKDPYCEQNPSKTGFFCVGGMKDGCSCFSTDDTITCSASCSCSLVPQAGCCYCSKPPVCPTTSGGTPVKQNYFAIVKVFCSFKVQKTFFVLMSRQFFLQLLYLSSTLRTAS